MQLVRALEGKSVFFFLHLQKHVLTMQRLRATGEQLTQAMGEAAQLKQRGDS